VGDDVSGVAWALERRWAAEVMQAAARRTVEWPAEVAGRWCVESWGLTSYMPEVGFSCRREVRNGLDAEFDTFAPRLFRTWCESEREADELSARRRAVNVECMAVAVFIPWGSE
jgi:hypothetical protein